MGGIGTQRLMRYSFLLAKNTIPHCGTEADRKKDRGKKGGKQIQRIKTVASYSNSPHLESLEI